MSAQIPEAKAALREQVRGRLKKMSAGERAAASAAVGSRLQEQAIWKMARAVLLYAPLPEELDVWPLIPIALAAGKVIALLHFVGTEGQYVASQIKNTDSDLRIGQFGIREPSPECPILPLNRLDLVLVPGVAFDLNGHRLGRGKGFYDRLLASVRGTTCGIAFDEQIVEAIPVAPHDVKLNCILTPKRWCCFANPRAVLE